VQGVDLGFRHYPSPLRSIKRVVEKIHVLTDRSGFSAADDRLFVVAGQRHMDPRHDHLNAMLDPK